MTYEQICEQNRFLYGALESLTSQISFIRERNIDCDTSGLKKRKDAIRELISLNLDKMEWIWEVEETSYRKARIKNNPENAVTEIPTGKELRVIERYAENPNQSIDTLAFDLAMNKDHVSRIITKYLTLKFNLIPA